jgi:hypothetical protein
VLGALGLPGYSSSGGGGRRLEEEDYGESELFKQSGPSSSLLPTILYKNVGRGNKVSDIAVFFSWLLLLLLLLLLHAAR